MTTGSPGFGLMELLVVVAVLSVVTVGATLAARPSGGDLVRAADMLRADAAQSRHLAMLSGLDHALLFAPSGWQTARRSASGWTMISEQEVTPVAITAPEEPWVLAADGAVPSLQVQLASGGTDRLCRASLHEILTCR